MIYCNWKKVKHLPIGSVNWHQGGDHLAGTTPSYGDPAIDAAPWGIAFQSFIFNQFAFATLDLAYYIIVEKSEILGSNYSGVSKLFIRSSMNTISSYNSPPV